GVDRGDRGGHDAGNTEIAGVSDQAIPSRLDREGVRADDVGGELPDEGNRRCAGVGVAEASVATSAHVHRDEGGRIPGEGSIGFGSVSGDAIGGSQHLADGLAVHVRFRLCAAATRLAPAVAKSSWPRWRRSQTWVLVWRDRKSNGPCAPRSPAMGVSTLPRS